MDIPPNLIQGKGMNQAKLISESGLYKLVMRSDKKEAKAFQDCVTKDVLPAIRKDGGYIMGKEKLKTGEMDDDEFIARWLDVRFAVWCDAIIEDTQLRRKTISPILGMKAHRLSRIPPHLNTKRKSLCHKPPSPH